MGKHQYYSRRQHARQLIRIRERCNSEESHPNASQRYKAKRKILEGKLRIVFEKAKVKKDVGCILDLLEKNICKHEE